ncbi:hypothetical protein KR074_003008, partial [Drosophila pseudoananassae]
TRHIVFTLISQSDALRSEYRPRRPCALLKYPRPKTKPEYQAIYPWLLPDETDPHFVFCAVCECRLSCKRSDLGKHEGSIKHTENAQRKSLAPKPEPGTDGSGVMKWEYNDEEECQLAYGSRANHQDEEDDEGDQEPDSDGECDEGDEEEGEPEAVLEPQNDFEAEPVSKQQRRISETDSQQSGLLDYLPLQVTINELPAGAGSLSGSSFPTSTSNATPQPPPCRITIKKVAGPLANMATPTTPPNPGLPQEISSKATITPITGSCYTSSPRAAPAYAPRQLQCYQPSPISSQSAPERPPRDSVELFFDSICATVKSLPPKLATEGKIRVMQLIGELELRAMGEQESSSQAPGQPIHDLAGNSAGSPPEATGSGQQNATVASTTK